MSPDNFDRLLFALGFGYVAITKAIPIYYQCTELVDEAYRQCSYPFNITADIALVVFGVMLALYLQNVRKRRDGRNESA